MERFEEDDLLFKATQDVGKPYWIQFTMDGQVFAFFAAVCLGTGVVFGLAPALHVSKTDLNEVLKLGGRTGAGGARRNARRILVIAEFSLALTLLACGGLALESFWNLTRIDLGIRTENVLSFRLPVPDHRLNTPEQIKTYYGQMLEKIQSIPGVRRAAAMTGVPGSGSGFGARFSIVGQPVANPSERPGAALQMATPQYVDTAATASLGRPAAEGGTSAKRRPATARGVTLRRSSRIELPLGQGLVSNQGCCPLHVVRCDLDLHSCNSLLSVG